MELTSPLKIYGNPVGGASHLIAVWGRTGGVGVGSMACLKEALGAVDNGSD